MNYRKRTYDQHPDDLDFGPTVLIVDDEESGRNRLQLLCSDSPAGACLRLLTANSIAETADILSGTPVHVLLLDKNLGPDESDPAHNGIESIPRFLQLQPQLQILVITGSKDTQDAARAITLGALWYLPKDTNDALISLHIGKAVHVASLALQNIRNTALRRHSKRPIDMAGHSVAITKLMSRLMAVAETNRPVLLLGESGCGKTTAAKLIHEYRKEFLKQPGRAIFSLNMGAISPSLAERELFGNEEGAYTGADVARPGFFELANNGTLFLDEIGEAPLDLQVKLLKVIEEGEFVRLGGHAIRHTSFKLICATNRDLEAMVARGEFREDLYFRISTFIVPVPSLSERQQDIPHIIRSILPKCCEDNNVFIAYEDLPHDFIDHLVTTPQRGNIRGIEHQLSRLLVYAPKDKRGNPRFEAWRDIPGLAAKRASPISLRAPITLKELDSRPFDVVGPDFTGLPEFMKAVEDRVIVDALNKHKTLQDAANSLKISLTKVSLDRKRIMRERSLVSRKAVASVHPAEAAGGSSQ